MAYSTGVPYQALTQTPAPVSTFDDEAFELAFAEAENAVHTAETMVDNEPEVAKEEQPILSEEEEAERLARTAGELYDKLQHERETDEKFRNSGFMALMQKLRDREIIVRGNDMVEVSTLNQEKKGDGMEEMTM